MERRDYRVCTRNSIICKRKFQLLPLSMFRKRRRRGQKLELSLTAEGKGDAMKIGAAGSRLKHLLLAKGCCEMLQARPVGTTPIVAWHEVPGKASLERTVP